MERTSVQSAESSLQSEPVPMLLYRRSPGQIMRWDSDLPVDLVEQIWQSPHVLLVEGERLQDKLRCTVIRIDHPGGQFTWKHHNWGSWQRAIWHSLSTSVARKSWSDATFLRAAGVRTPRPRAYLEHRFGPFQRSSYLLTDYVVGTSLYRLMRYERPTTEFVRHLARQVAEIWQQLDELCVWHNDFKTENLLVDPASRVWLIDFEKMRRFPSQASARRRQVMDAGRLLDPRNWRANPWAAESFRREILKTPAAIETLAGTLGVGHPLNKPVPSLNRPCQLISVLIPCRNAADIIGACIESVRDMADEILVADSGSIDGTIERVHKLGGCRVVQFLTDDELHFEAWAHRQASHSWVLRILPHERLDAELSKKVQDTIATEPAVDGFRVSRIACRRGQRLRHGFQHGAPIRLYRKRTAQFEWHAGRIEVSLGSARVGQLPGYLVYDACGNTDTAEERQRMRPAA